jgi:NADH-quinone oxidoreductase subunit C
MTYTTKKLAELLQQKLSNEVVSVAENIDCAEIYIKPQKLLGLASILKMDADFQFNMLLSVTAVDWLDARDDRFEVVYHLLSMVHGCRLRIKIALPETAPSVPSLCSTWASANFMERETYDMYGITFEGHPDLRRILMYDEFVGYPLRKDYPIQGKQPRIPLRYPEVRNTAVDMQRPDLVTITPKRKAA